MLESTTAAGGAAVKNGLNRSVRVFALWPFLTPTRAAVADIAISTSERAQGIQVRTGQLRPVLEQHYERWPRPGVLGQVNREQPDGEPP